MNMDDLTRQVRILKELIPQRFISSIVVGTFWGTALRGILIQISSIPFLSEWVELYFPANIADQWVWICSATSVCMLYRWLFGKTDTPNEIVELHNQIEYAAKMGEFTPTETRQLWRIVAHDYANSASGTFERAVMGKVDTEAEAEAEAEEDDPVKS
ncbi:hypothetical protein [Idiomarina abyssalis]|uniref:hypothetical protein n=1 Tax=Idiomarina abyssalis TaxID=86102 RepID=UPI003A8E3139